MDAAKVLADLQAEQVEWVRKNFGDRPPWMPLMGICEEIGEWYEACNAGCPDAQKDALADIVIFVSDYCSGRGWSLVDVWTDSFFESGHGLADPVGMSICIGRIQHHYLKEEQGIRGSADRHDAMGRAWLAKLLRAVRLRAEVELQEPIAPLVWRTWERVRQRNWRTPGCQKCGSDGNGCKCPGGL